ncbi:hypothetical protein ACFXDE_34490 [Kitasatospora sp. NPDC059408]
MTTDDESVPDLVAMEAFVRARLDNDGYVARLMDSAPQLFERAGKAAP